MISDISVPKQCKILFAVLPTFDVKITSEKEYILPNDTELEVKIHAM